MLDARRLVMTVTKLVRRFRSVALLCLLVACVGAPDSDTAIVAHHAPMVSTSKTSYLPNEAVTVNWSELPGNQMDWVSINVAGSSPTTGFVAFAFTNGQVMGSQQFGGLPVGNYEARAYVDNTYQIIAMSTFTVGQSTAATITTDQPTYQANQSVAVSWTNMPGNNLDWVAINVAGSAPNAGFVQWTYIGGQMSGSTTFNNIPAGSYEARAYRDNTYEILATSSFSVVSTTVSTNKAVYTQGETVVVTFASMPGNQNDYISINTAGSAPNAGFVATQYTTGEVNGTRSFANLPVGSYEARAYLDNTFTVLATTSFTVSASTTTITTDKITYADGETVIVSWTDLPGNTNDWIAIYPSGSPDTGPATQWLYTNGAASGMHAFTGIPSGSYEARAYLNNTFSVLARSPIFVVGMSMSTCTSAPVRPVFEGMTTGEITIGAMARQVDIPLTVPLDRSILFTSVRENEASPGSGGVICELHDEISPSNPAGITCARNDLGGAITVRYSVATFTSGVTVQRGTVDTHSANPTNVTISTVTPAQSFVILNGQFNDGSGWGNNEFVRASLTSATNLELRNNAAGTEVSWQVIDMIGASVQRGSTTFASGDTARVIMTGPAPSGSVAFVSYTTDNPSGIEAATMMLQASLIDSTSLELRRSLGGSALDISWEVASLPFATVSGTATFAAGASTSSSPISGHSVAASVAIASSQAINGQSSGSTTFAGTGLDVVGEAQGTLSVSASTVDVQRAASQASAEIPWTVIDFSRDCTGF
jgi:hypothetical protein